MLFEMGLKYPGKEAQIGDLIMSGVGQTHQDSAVRRKVVHEDTVAQYSDPFACFEA